MKKCYFFLLVYIFSIICIYAQNYNEPESITKLDIDEYFVEYSQSYVTGKKGESYIVWNWGSKSGLKISNDNINTENDGFQFFIIENEKKLILSGSNFFFILSPDIWRTIKYERTSSIKNTIESINEFNKDSNWISYISLCEFDIKKIVNSSFYTETTRSGDVKYTADYLNIIFESQIDSSTYLLHNPWVPGKEKNTAGIGEYLEIEFSKPKDNVVILNGFVDFDKRYLYKANNRVKKAVVTSLDKNNPFEIEYEFEDYVHFSEIKFPVAVDKIRFTIKEVYKGDKWDDTCITAVITRWEE